MGEMVVLPAVVTCANETVEDGCETVTLEPIGVFGVEFELPPSPPPLLQPEPRVARTTAMRFRRNP
jgi:hypothetical protein